MNRSVSCDPNSIRLTNSSFFIKALLHVLFHLILTRQKTNTFLQMTKLKGFSGWNSSSLDAPSLAAEKYQPSLHDASAGQHCNLLHVIPREAAAVVSTIHCVVDPEGTLPPSAQPCSTGKSQAWCSCPLGEMPKELPGQRTEAEE